MIYTTKKFSCQEQNKMVKFGPMTIEAPEPLFADFSPELGESYNPEKVLAKVFLPFSDLNWINFERWGQLRQSFLDHQEPPVGYIQDVSWLEKDEEGNLMPGNIKGEIYGAVNSSLPLQRLHYIKQLSLLTHSGESEENPYLFIGSEFSQTRLLHVFLTARVLESILKRNNFSSQEVNLGIMAGLIHDLATPAFGDPTKEIDPDVLSEDKALERLLGKYDLSDLEKFGFDRERLLAIVQNGGAIGQLLDLVDKIAYTAVDVYFYAGQPPFFPDQGALTLTLKPLRKILSKDPHWANIYQEVAVTRDGQPYFRDSRRLGRFLELRALMHRTLYLNPHCRGHDLMYKMLLRPLYNREPDPGFPFNQDNLLLYTDDELGRILNKHWQIMGVNLPLQSVLGVLPDYKRVKKTEEVPTVVLQLEEKGLFPIGAEVIGSFDSGVDFLTISPEDNQIRPYSEVNQKHAQKLREIVASCHQTVVYYWPQNPFIEETWGKTLKPVIARLVREARLKNNGQLPCDKLY